MTELRCPKCKLYRDALQRTIEYLARIGRTNVTVEVLLRQTLEQKEKK